MISALGRVHAFMIKTWVMVAVALMVLLGSAILSEARGEPEWIARAGSVATVVGLLLTVKRSLLCSAPDTRATLVKKLHYDSVGPLPRPGTDAYRQAVEQVRRILRDEYLGMAIIILGTVTWGYGDLIVALVL